MTELNKFQRLRESEKVAKTKKFLTFMLGSEECAIDISFVQEIKVSLNILAINKAISVPPHIIGMTYLYNTVVPVTDIRIFCQLAEEDNKKENVTILLKLHNYLFGMQISKAMEVIEVPVNNIKVSPEFFSHCANNYISEIVQIQEHLIGILDVEKLYFSEAFRVSQLELTRESGDSKNVVS